MAVELFSLGKIYPSDFLLPGEEPRCEPVELKLVMDEHGLVKLANTAPKECLWGERYWYRSSVSQTMKAHLRDLVDSIFEVFKAEAGSIFLDIAGNDGYLLSQVPAYLTTVSIDPAGGEIKSQAEKRCDVVIRELFSKEAYRKKMGLKNAHIVSAVSMFYDLEDPDTFLKDVYSIMEDDGLLVLQLSYTPLMLEQLEFGNICHEHVAYYSLFNIRQILDRNDFKIMDVSLNNTNAGSFRIFAMKENADITKFGSSTHRDVCMFRIASLGHYENILMMDFVETWTDFFEQVNALKQKTLDFIKSEKAKGKVIMGYGASTKFNTVLQYFGLTTEHITAIAERDPSKYGLRTVGSSIPIISEYEMRQARPDYLLVGPAHFISEFKEREIVLLKTGTKFITIMPKFEIISA